ncbi:hypothetical protein HELRODRAFT_162998 [Helobdella robusta]|uniref:Zinc finger PHD-type domain-containing protein n=1 Tax=Helobdella robusta TaxID=6412 RepID=T1ETJ0_HELRO|nr:hypothetical protein HELRODRAFT_162998 [Helobdella robusta]ESN99449.1 hypothetical protein HELRODRAFT_162998 [Helobdella robusta]
MSGKLFHIDGEQYEKPLLTRAELSMAVKCLKCLKVMKEKDEIKCFQCEAVYHIKCGGLSNASFDAVTNAKNVKWFYNCSLKVLPNVKMLANFVKDNNVRIEAKIEEINDLNAVARDELKQIKNQKKGNNIVMFNLPEKEDNVNRVKNRIKKLSSDVNNHDIEKIFKLEHMAKSKISPILIGMKDDAIKGTVMKNSFKLKSLSDDLDLAWSTSRIKKLVDEEKANQPSSLKLLFRVKGTIGKWRIVKLKKPEK